MGVLVTGEQRPSVTSIAGPLAFYGNLTANTTTTVLMLGSNAYPALIPMLTGGKLLAISGFRNTQNTAGAVTVQVALVPAGSALGSAPQPISGATYSAPAGGGANYVSLYSSPPTFAAQDSFALLLTTATAGAASLTVHLFLGA